MGNTKHDNLERRSAGKDVSLSINPLKNICCMLYINVCMHINNCKTHKKIEYKYNILQLVITVHKI